MELGKKKNIRFTGLLLAGKYLLFCTLLVLLVDMALIDNRINELETPFDEMIMPFCRLFVVLSLIYDVLLIIFYWKHNRLVDRLAMIRSLLPEGAKLDKVESIYPDDNKIFLKWVLIVLAIAICVFLAAVCWRMGYVWIPFVKSGGVARLPQGYLIAGAIVLSLLPMGIGAAIMYQTFRFNQYNLGLDSERYYVSQIERLVKQKLQK